MKNKNTLSDIGIEELLLELRTRETPELKEGFYTPDTYNPLDNYDTNAIIEAVRTRQKVIYGPDNRQDLFEVNDQTIQKCADSVVSLWKASDITDNHNGTSTLKTENFGTHMNLCHSEPFRDQPIGAFCSGFLVASNVIATAAHCIRENNLINVRFVFGYRMTNTHNAQTIIDNNEIYSGQKVIGRQLARGGTDWALIELDRPVTNHPILTIRKQGRIANNQPIYVIGHPVGLPIKYAPDAEVRDNTPVSFFAANLDTYGGNSGSPVFNANTHDVEGILVRGDVDFTMNGHCRSSLVWPNTGGRGEDCTRTTQFTHLFSAGVGSEIERHYWSNGWTNTSFYTINNTTYLFLLKAGNGHVHIHKMNNNGSVGSEIERHDWSSGWTTAHIYTVDNINYLFLLKVGTGEVHIHKINTDGRIGSETERLHWSSGWTTANFYNMNGKTYLFLLKASTGDVHIHKMNNNGTVGQEIERHHWSNGWTTANFYSNNGNTYLFLLKEGTGEVHIHKMKPNGGVGSEIERHHWSRGWTTAHFYTINRTSYLFLLKAGNGSVHIHRMNNNGSVGDEIERHHWSGGWTTVSVYSSHKSHYLFLLKAGDGHVHIHKVGWLD